ncbi:MAG: cytochrome c oxidase subunit 2 [Betaproteobacteria bacterium]|nr:MAG: cytochrome c oxidase subunit 2 [Betaproteobacteria bacterium]
MSAIQPPAQRVWWKQPIHKEEVLWIGIAFAWCLVMFFMMPYWHVYGKQNLSSETYRVTPALFQKAAEEMVAKYTVRTETDEKVPVVHPPAGADIYLIARLWDWWPILELEQGKTYRLHLTAMDYQHGFSLQPENINVQVIPGYQHVITITPNRAGTYAIVCNEFCGIGHHKMVSKLYVK